MFELSSSRHGSNKYLNFYSDCENKAAGLNTPILKLKIAIKLIAKIQMFNLTLEHQLSTFSKVEATDLLYSSNSFLYASIASAALSFQAFFSSSLSSYNINQQEIIKNTYMHFHIISINLIKETIPSTSLKLVH